MYFKRLELVGFKSFAERTKLKFEPGVTAVVGPNGCGKSNIADAIKWVLGEQSAKELRGSRMEDVIFNGTSNKEPINMAEVSLVLSNEDKALPIDYEEVIITRRLFRSGESEYSLNKTPVRLKDIADLLAGTGIGANAYSIIEQGQIGQILSSKPEDRRYIFEEASGITKFKLKKKEALRKLEHTENNLLRINDIITEVERQIKSIERQAKKAEKYREDFEVLKDLELRFSGFHYKNISAESKALSLENQDYKKREEELLNGQKRLSDEVRSSKDILLDLNSELQKTEIAITEAAANIDKNKHAIQLDGERMEELKLSQEDFKKEIEILEGKLKSKKSDLKNSERELSGISSVKSDKENQIISCQGNLEKAIKELSSHQEEIKTAKNKIVDLMASQSKIKNELMELGIDLQNRKIRQHRLLVEKENLSKEKSSLEVRINERDNELDKTRNGVSSKKETVLKLNNEIKDLGNSLDSRQNQIIDLRKTKEILKSKLELLTELIQKQEGFDKSIRAIKEKVPGILSVAEVISVGAGFEKAVECLLGELAQALIVDKREEAIALIDFIEKENLGRASFLIHEDVKCLKPKTTGGISKDISPVTDFIKYDMAYKDIVYYLFNNAYMAGDYKEANQLFTRFRAHRFVTKTGYLREGPRVKGGAILESDTSIIGRKEKVKRMEDELLQIDLRLEDEVSRKGREENVLGDIRDNLNQEETLLKEKETEFVNLSAQRNNLLNEMKKIDEEENVVGMELEDVKDGIQSLTSKGVELNKRLNKLEEESAEEEELISRCEEGIKEKTNIKEEKLLKIANLNGELSSLKVTHTNLFLNLNQRKTESEEIENEIRSKHGQINSCLQKIKTCLNEVERLDSQIQDLEENKTLLDRKLSVLKDKRDIETDELDKKEAILDEKEKDLEGIRDDKRDLEIKLTEINYKKSSIVERIRQSYNVNLDELNINIEENTNWDETKERIEELKERIQNLGPVNLVAIEEHKELEERLSFLTHQRDDLVKAKESLHKAIIKINVTTKELFIETFQKIQNEFRDYFRMLFGGGHAEIYLLDEKDVLESGIEIVARPPGKKLQNILLLSGGESALTAIALLFAIFKTNPSPFCVLDEIDAALDESNIDRFTRVLREFIKSSQFILITHNKKTIQMADILYGITMAERGISKIVSVKFADDKKDTAREEIMV